MLFYFFVVYSAKEKQYGIDVLYSLNATSPCCRYHIYSAHTTALLLYTWKWYISLNFKSYHFRFNQSFRIRRVHNIQSALHIYTTHTLPEHSIQYYILVEILFAAYMHVTYLIRQKFTCTVVYLPELVFVILLRYISSSSSSWFIKVFGLLGRAAAYFTHTGTHTYTCLSILTHRALTKHHPEHRRKKPWFSKYTNNRMGPKKNYFLMKFRMDLHTSLLFLVRGGDGRPNAGTFWSCLVKMFKTICCCLMDVYYDLIFNEFIFALTLLSALFFTYMWAFVRVFVCVCRGVAEGRKIDKGTRSEMGVWMCGAYDLWCI